MTHITGIKSLLSVYYVKPDFFSGRHENLAYPLKQYAHA